MRNHGTLLPALALALALGACTKDEGQAGGEEMAQQDDSQKEPSGKSAPDKPDEPAEQTESEEGQPGAGEVSAATAEDLARFTEDLEGDGALTATIETSKGDFHCELFEEKAPLTVANFVGLARGKLPWKDPKSGEVVERRFYDGLTFHRVIPGFMIQGGCPLGTGRGGPGFRFATEVSDELRHDRPGILSTANAGPDTNGSQFFIMEEPKAHLDGKHNVFGHCEEADLVEEIARVPTGARNKPQEPVTIERVVISRKSK